MNNPQPTPDEAFMDYQRAKDDNADPVTLGRAWRQYLGMLYVTNPLGGGSLCG